MARRVSLPKFESAQDVRLYVQSLSGRKAEDDPWVKLWRTAKHATLLTVLAGSFLIYYLLGVLEEVMQMPHLEVNVTQVAMRGATNGFLRR